MKHLTEQEQFWQGDFGREYTERNRCNPKQMDEMYTKTWGVKRSAMNDRFLQGRNIETILEVGCNAADQLELLQSQGYQRLYGIEIQDYAAQRGRELTKNINIVQGSAFDLPFKDAYFDLVFTSGVLIHIHPDDLEKIMREMYRVSKKYLWGFEFFDPEFKKINYRGHDNKHWKGDYAKKFMELFLDLQLVKTETVKYLANDNVDMMYLLEKGKG